MSKSTDTRQQSCMQHDPLPLPSPIFPTYLVQVRITCTESWQVDLHKASAGLPASHLYKPELRVTGLARVSAIKQQVNRENRTSFISHLRAVKSLDENQRLNCWQHKGKECHKDKSRISSQQQNNCNTRFDISSQASKPSNRVSAFSRNFAWCYKILGRGTSFRLSLVNKTLQCMRQGAVRRKEFHFLPGTTVLIPSLLVFEYE